MKQLSIYSALGAPPADCRWVMREAGRTLHEGTGLPSAALCAAVPVRVILAAAGVLLLATRLPPGASRHASQILAYAVEDRVLGEPDAQQVCWLGRAGAADVLAVMDKAALDALLSALAGVGVAHPLITCETLLLPRAEGEWSVWWDGRGGFVRTAALEGTVLDETATQGPPLTLRLLLDAAHAAPPAALAVYAAPAAALPALETWQRELSLPVRAAGVWNWHEAAAELATPLLPRRGVWAALRTRLRLPAILVAAALGLHVIALLADGAWLRHEQQVLQSRMETTFRRAVPEALAVVDPALQMRRKLAEARRLAGVADRADFLPMLEQLALALKAVPSADLYSVSYSGGRLVAAVRGLDETTARELIRRLGADDIQLDARLTPAVTGGGYQIAVQAP